jgi:tetratricopeptide (TPR) repeat protein
VVINAIGERGVNRLYGFKRDDLTTQERFVGDLDKVRFHKREKDFDRALLLVNKLLVKEPEFLEALFLKGQILWEGFENREAAKNYLEKVIQMVEEDEPLYRWASTYMLDMSSE